MKKTLKILSILTLIISLSLSLVACDDNKDTINKNTVSSKELEKKEDVKLENKEENKEEKKQEEKKRNKVIKLYFADEEANNLVAEDREVEEVSPKIVIDELLKGPKTKGFNRTLPEGVKINSVKVKNKIAYIDFDGSIDGKIQGNTGESMAIYSTANSLILNKDLNVESVVYKINGEKIDSFSGHMILDKPIKENKEIIKK